MIHYNGSFYEVFDAKSSNKDAGPEDGVFTKDDLRTICDKAIRAQNSFRICKSVMGQWHPIYVGQLFSELDLEFLDVFWGMAWRAPWGSIYALREVSYQGAMEELVFDSWDDYRAAALGVDND